MGSCYKVMNWRWAVKKAALVSLFGDSLRERIGGIQLGWCIMRSRMSLRRGFRCVFPSGDSLTLTCQVCCVVCVCARVWAAERGRQRWQAQSHLTRARAMPFRTVSSRVRCAQSRVHSAGRGGLARGRHRSDAHSSVLFFSRQGQLQIT
jgi:hypothetical protein